MDGPLDIMPVCRRDQSEADVFLELIELGAQECEVAVDLLAACDHGIDLVGEPHVLGLLCNQIVLAAFTPTYIFSSNILTSMTSLVFDSSVECLPSFSSTWNSVVTFFKALNSYVS
jgi:hypothetical protein